MPLKNGSKKIKQLKKRILTFAQKGRVYPSYIAPLINQIPDNLFLIFWDLTGNFQLQEEDVEFFLEALKSTSEEEKILRALTEWRKQKILKGEDIVTEIDHAFSQAFQSFVNYMTIFVTRYITKNQLGKLHVADEHLQKSLDFGFGIFQVFLDMGNVLPASFWEEMCRRLQFLTEEASSFLAEKELASKFTKSNDFYPQNSKSQKI